MPVIVFLYILTLVYSISFYYPVEMYGAYQGAPLINFILCHFIHINILHLIMNGSLIALYWKSLSRYNMKFVIPIVFVSSILSAYLSAQETPTIGASSIVMSMIGVLCAFFSKSNKIRINILVIATCLISGLLAQHINTYIHLYSFYISFAVSLLTRRFMYAKG